MIKLVLTNTYYSVFSALNKCLEHKVNFADGKNLIFCDEKISLMVERSICSKFNGSFNTDVYSFGNYMRAKSTVKKALTKEGSSMVVKRVLQSTPLQSLKANKQNLAPTLFELISQLKSANVTPQNLIDAVNEQGDKLSVLLKNKLNDVIAVYSAYQEYIAQNDYQDQSSLLDNLSNLIEQEPSIENTDVYLVAMASFTAQTKNAIKTLLKKAKSVTAILVEGQNEYAYVNETCFAFRSLCKEQGVDFSVEYFSEQLSAEQQKLLGGLFNPLDFSDTVIKTDKIKVLSAKTVGQEAERVALAIKELINTNQARYKDVTLIVPDISTYREQIKEHFSLLDIPYFIDERIKPLNHPLIILINAFYDLKRKGLDRNTLCTFIKNPLVLEDKQLADGLENYITKYNLFYSRLFEPFTFACDKRYVLQDFENARQFICKLLSAKDGLELLQLLNAQQKIDTYTKTLSEIGENEQASVNKQIYQAVIGIFEQMQDILHGITLDYTEIKNVFTSGINALELAIIPQYDDAVFIGGFKQATLVKANHLFVMGLTDAVPGGKEDVALLSDGDIDELEKVKVMIEPKVRVINKRTKESVALGLCSFEKSLHLSYPITSESNDKNSKSEVFNFVLDKFTCQEFTSPDGYYTEKQGVLTFAKACSDFYDGIIGSFEKHSAFYALKGDNKIKSLLDECNKEIKVYLERNKEAIIKTVSSATAIENFYACPYKAFLSHGLRLREKENGKVNSLSFGNVMHEIFAQYVKQIDSVTDRQSSDDLFEKCKVSVLQNPDYQRFYKDEVDSFVFEKALAECKNYCYKTYVAQTNSLFRTDYRDIEVYFGEPKGKFVPRYPALSLGDGKVKLSGKIDRIDTYKDYARVVDYKTGKATDDLEFLFAGTKLQLYLYGAIINDKKLAGVYYLPVNENFTEEDQTKKPLAIGKTVNDQEVVTALDKTVTLNGKGQFLPVTYQDGVLGGVIDGDTMGALVTYAVKMGEQAVKQMGEGVIVPSSYDDACKYCSFGAMCESKNLLTRKLKTVKETLIRQAIEKGESEDGT